MKYLLLAPHTDDIELGCGGTVLKLLAEGHEIHWVVFSTAEDSVPAGMPKDTLKIEFLNVMEYLNIPDSAFEVLHYPVRNFNIHRQDILEKMVAIRRKFKPDYVIGPSPNDVHQDHAVISNEMIRAFKTSASILCYELPWNHTTFNNQCFSKLTADIVKQKFEMLSKYESQINLKRTYFTKDFIYSWAKMRGIQCNTEYAEAFEVIRWIL